MLQDAETKKKASTNCTAQPRPNLIKEKLLFRKSFVNFCRHVISMTINHTGNLFSYFYASTYKQRRLLSYIYQCREQTHSVTSFPGALRFLTPSEQRIPKSTVKNCGSTIRTQKSLMTYKDTHEESLRKGYA